MAEETIVAIFDTAAHANAAITDLKAAGVPDAAISLHAGTTMTSGATGGTTSSAMSGMSTATTSGLSSDMASTQPVREKGFWSSLFGGETDTDSAVYDRSLESGSTVVTVRSPDEHVTRVMEILESHNPIDIDERTAGYGLAKTATTAAAPAAATGMASATGDKLQLSEENLAVGKRVVNKGGTRIRRYVVETPVTENVSLHDETVTLERHPVTDGRSLAADEFSEKTIEMTASAEEAVVSKTARVYEEVGLRKEATDRTETVRDTVRKEEVEIEQIPGQTTTATTRPVVTETVKPKI